MAIAYIAYQRVRPSFGGDEKRIQLAVLPIENLTGSAQQDFLSEGLTEEFITLLRRLHPERLVVLGQSSTAKYRGAIRDPTAIGRELGVDYILEGKLGRAGNQLGLSLQLVQTKSNLMVWSEQTLLESPMDLSLAQSMSQAVAENLNLQSVSIFADTAPIHSEAFWELLKGRFYARRALANGKDIAKNHFRRAIEFDPNYAPAYAALAEALAASTALLTDELIQGTAATLKALELAPNLPEAHTAAGLVAMYHLDWASAERSLRRGVELDPNSPHARLQLAVLLRNLGRFEQAMKEIREAQQLDPLSVVVNRELGITQFYAREFSSAVSQLRATLEIDPADPESQIWFAQSCAYQGLFGEADAAIAKLSVVPVQNKDLRLAQIFASRGEKERARAILKSATAPGERPNPFEAAAAHAALFERSIALDWLEKGVQNRHPGRVILRIDPRLDSLRADPRFAQLLREIGLSP
jgi:TolB-like protein/Flp pilus assembly protein TadD